MLIIACIPCTLSAQSFTATQNENDAYIDVNWTYDVDPCLLNAIGEPYSGAEANMAIQLKRDGAQIFSQTINNLTPFLGPPQPDFDYVTYVTDSLGYYIYDFSSDPAVQAANNYTIEVWMRSEKQSSYIFNDIFPNSNIRLVDHQEISFTEFGTEVGSVTFPPLRLAAWNHFAFAANGLGQTLIYVNGEYAGLIQFKFPLTEFRSFGGTSGTSYAEMRVWDRLRTESEINNNFLVNTFSPTLQDLIIQLKHPNAPLSVMTDFAMVDGNTQIFAIDTSFSSTIPYEATPDYTALSGTYRDEIGPGQSANYQIRLFYNSFLIEPDCGDQFATGQTLPYQNPTQISVSNDHIEKIILKWKNNSTLTTSFIVTRDGNPIATISSPIAVGDTFHVEDKFIFNDISSIENGETYQYTIETFSQQTSQTYPEVAGSGSTVPIQFSATDMSSGFNNKIETTWSSGIGSFADKYELRRNGDFVLFLDSEVFNYTDFLPIYGEVNDFEFILWKDNQRLVADYDHGSVPPNGMIKGRVLTQKGNYPVSGVSVTATAENGASTGNSVTNALGEFEIFDLTYGLIDSFTLQANLVGHSFVQVADSFITLTRNTPLTDGIIILDTEEYATDNTTITINSFNATPQNQQDQVILDWSANASISNVFVELIRDGKAIYTGQGTSALNNLAFDTDGTPGANVKYQLRVYTINNAKVNEEMSELMVTFPSVATVPALSVTTNQTDGVVDLSWNHSSVNISGFNLYRNGKLIGHVEGVATQFTDSCAYFNTDLQYQIAATRSVSDVVFEASQPTTGQPDPVNLGVYPTPANVIASQKLNGPSVILQWAAPSGIGLNYNYTGYRIYRDQDLLAVVYKDRPLEYEDREGFGFTGAYHVSTFLYKSDGTIQESVLVPSNQISYPSLPVVPNMTVFLANPNESVHFYIPYYYWALFDYDNFNGFKWYKDGQLFLTTPSNVYFIYDATPNTGTFNYEVRTYREVNGQTFLSDPLSQVVNVNSPDMPLPHPENVIASRDLPNHVKLCWDYPDFIPAKFEIRAISNGIITFTDTLPPGTRAFYDYESDLDNPLIRYYIKAIIDTSESKVVFANGDIIDRKSIYGSVRQASNGLGIPNVDVRLCLVVPDFNLPEGPVPIPPKLLLETKTDSTGFYYFDFDPATDGEGTFTFFIKVSSPNSQFLTDSVQIEFDPNINSYRIDFEDNYLYPIPPENPTRIAQLAITPDTMSLNMLVHFNTNNNKYDYVEMSRGLTDLEDVQINEPKLSVDSLAAPGIIYGYSSRAIEELENGRAYSKYEITEAQVPALKPVFNLTGTVLPDQNAVWIQWSHRYNNASKYVILRNDAFLTEVQKNEPFQFVDQTGQPGTAYKYTLVAVLDRDGNAYTSEPISVEVRFPNISPPTDLMATVPFLEDVFLADSLPLDTQYTLNHVELKWSYSDTNIQSFKIYRNGELVNEVDKSTKMYKDFEFIPSSNVNYSVSVTKLVNGNLLESALSKVCPQEGICIAFPDLSPPSNFEIEFRDSLADILFTLDYLPKGADGFYIYRSHTTDFENFDLEYDTVISFTHDPLLDSASIEFIYKRSPVFWNLYYAIQAFTVRDGVEYRSEIIPFAEPIFQEAFPPPYNFTATDGDLLNAVKLSWDYPKEIPLEADFLLIRTTPGSSGSTQFFLDPGQRSFIDSVDFVPADGYWEYRLLSLYNGYNVIYTAAVDNGHPKLQTNQIELSPINASNNPSVSIDGEWMVVGDAEVNVKIYRFENAHWKLFQVIPNTFLGVIYGHSVDVSGDRMIIGSVALQGSGNQGYVQLLKFENESWNVTNTIGSGTESWGFATAIDGDRCIMTDPYNAFITVFDLSSGLKQIKFSQTVPELFAQFQPGVSADISGDHFVIGVSQGVGLFPDGFGGFNGISSGMALTYEFANDSIYFVDTLLPSSGYFDNSFFGWDVAIDSHHVAMGQFASLTQSYGAIEVFQRNQNGSYDFAQQINSPSPTSPSNDQFGWRVDIKNNFLVTTSPYYNGNTDVSQIHLYEYGGSQWSEIQINRPDFSETGNPDLYPEFLGWNLHLSDHYIALTNAETSVHVLDILPYFVSNVAATDDTEPFVEVTWSLDQDQDNAAHITHFAVFRDNVHVADVDKTDSVFIDRSINLLPLAPQAIAGQKHIYVIKPVLTNGFYSLYQSPATSDEGSFIQNGKLSGLIYVNGTTIPVEGARVTCEAMINENSYSFSFVTGADGAFSFDSLPYASDGTIYNLTPTYLDHKFKLVTPFAIPPLKPTDFTEESIVFYDTEAYTIYGDIKKLDTRCGLDDINVVLCKTVNGTTTRTDSTRTQDGQYAFAVNPLEVGLEKLSIIVPDVQTFENGNQQDSIRFGFKTTETSIFTDLGNFSQFNEINFTDTLTYPVTIQVQNTCGAPISSNSFDVRIYTSDGCYDESFSTNQSGFITTHLPTKDYLIVVTGVDGSSQNEQFAVEYLSSRPTSLAIQTAHDDSQLGTAPTFDIVKLTYHKAAAFGSIVNLFDRYICDNFNQPAILTQGESYSIPLSVSETHGTSCNVNEGYIVIRNAAADSAAVTQINFENGGFENYSFKAGFPNLVAPHLYEIDFTYFSEAGDLLANMTQTVLVEGERSLPGSGVIVEPNQDSDGQVKLPMIILRDPPGDQSYAKIENGASFTKSYSFDLSKQNDGGIYSEGSVGFGAGLLIGGFWNLDARWGRSTSDKTNLDFTLSNVESFSTSISEEAIGRTANVIVGAGFASQYGVTQRLEVVDCDSTAITNKLRFGLSDLATTWSYTVKFIEGIIKENIADSILIEKGLKNYYYADGSPFSQEDARIKVSALIQSWKDILYYHDVESVPHYSLCASNAFLDEILNEDARGQILSWRSNFCAEVGNYVGHDYVLDETVIWDNTLLTKYNNTIAAIEALKGLPQGFDLEPNTIFSQSRFTDPNYSVTSDYHNQLGVNNSKSAEIIDVSGQVLKEKTVTTQQSGSATYEYTGYSSIDLKAGLYSKFKGVITIPIINQEITVAESESKLGFAYSGRSSETTTRQNADANTSTMYYRILDGDAEDQVSTVVLQGPMQNHSPYFIRLGGKSSCPEEEALTIGNDADPVAIDNPYIAVVNSNSGAVIASGEEGANHFAPPQYNIPTNELAAFDLVIANNSPTTLTRDIEVFMPLQSNPNGAIVTLNGTPIGLTPILLEDVPSTNGGGTSLPFTLRIERPAGDDYDFENIQIGVRPGCDGKEKFIYVSAFFQSPCSPVTLTSPIDGFVVNREKVNVADDREFIRFELRDYQSDNLNLEGIQLQYQRLGTGIGWESVPLGYIQRATLASSDAMIAPGEQKLYFFEWDITGQYDLYPDGDYALRAVAKCNAGGDKMSNKVNGEIARTQILTGATEPSDGIWSVGDEISIAYSVNMDCGVISTPSFVDSNLVLLDLTTGFEVPFNIVCQNNKVIYQPIGGMTQYDGHLFKATAKEMKNIQGNFAQDEEWTFRVSAQDVEWKDEMVEVYLYQGSVLEKKTSLLNLTTGSVGELSLLQSASSEPWLEVTPNGAFDILNNDLLINLQFIGTQPIGVYDDTIVVNGLSGRMPEIPVRMHVLPTPPQIEVNSSYGDSMLLLINWRFDMDSELSNDTLDQIQAYVGNEVRGSGRIQKSGPFYQAAFWVRGETVEAGTALDFEVWNSDEAGLYEGLHIPSDIKFTPDATLGTTSNPEVLIVESGPIIRKRIYVDSAQVNNPHTGFTWSTAFNKLEDALAIAMPLDTIWMAGGTYYPTESTDRNASFDISTNLIIYGGFAFGQSAPTQRTGTVQTRLSGDIGIKASQSDNSYHVINSNSNFLIIDGITIEEGNANGAVSDGSGGAITNSGFTTLRNCQLHANASTEDGSIILNTGVEAKMILQDVQLSSEGTFAWIKNTNGAKMTVIGGGVTVGE